MTIEEKMTTFKKISLESANEKSKVILNSYKESLDKELEKHKAFTERVCRETKAARISEVKSTAKKELASKQASIRSQLADKHEEVRSLIFSNVLDKIKEYRKTEEYKNYLINQIKSVMETYSDYDITIYIDVDDSYLLDDLVKQTGGHIEINKNSFLGGIRTIVPSKNILIDSSFKSRLAEEKEAFMVSI